VTAGGPASPPKGGTEPDYRFTLANERTFLAWIRTSLALLAAGVAVREITLPMAVRHGRGLLSDLCVGLAVALVAMAFVRWRSSQNAMRDGAPLPPARMVGLLAVGVFTIAVVGGLLIALR